MFDQVQLARDEQHRCKARVKARLLGRANLAPRVGRFELVRLLGQGSTGVVYEAREHGEDRSVALKLLSHVEARTIARFKREFRALSEISHDNLVQLRELFTDSDEWYYTMELVQGVSFTEFARVSSDDVLGYDEAKLVHSLRQLLSAVSFMHGAQRVHCDLKPSNVLVTSEGRVVVLDFSLTACMNEPASAVASASAYGSGLFGTPHFMAPELFDGQPHSAASDAYAIGVMLFQVLYGELPERRQLGAGADSAGAPVHRPASQPTELHALCAELMAPDPGLRLSVEQALDRVRSRDIAASKSGAVYEPAFVGRAPELAALHAALADSRRGLPLAIFVSGPSGIGKSALCEHFASELRGKAVVLRSRCYEREALPYKAFDGVMDALVSHLLGLRSERRRELKPAHIGALARMFPALRGVPEWAAEEAPVAIADRTELRRRAFIAMKSLLRALAAAEPLAVLVDDLQWADVDSAHLLLELLGPPDAPAMLYVGFYRTTDDARGAFLRELFADSIESRWQCERRALSLDGLADVQASELARQLLRASAAPSHAIERVVRAARGNPLLVSELSLYLASESPVDDAALSLPGLFTWRMALLSPTARRVLTLLALASRPLSEPLLARALDSEPDAETSLRQLHGLGLVRLGANAAWTIYHDALREYVARWLPEHSASELHRTLALAYERTRNSEPQWLIEHWRGAGEPLRALEYALAAARAAVNNLAFHRAVDLYEAAIGLLPAQDPRRSSLQTELADALVNAGRSTQAARAFLEAVPSADPATAAALRCRALQHYFRGGDAVRGNALLQQLLREVGVRHPRTSAGLVTELALSRARLGLRSWLPAKLRSVSARRTIGSASVLESVFRELSLEEPLRGALLLSLFHEAAVASGRREQRFVAMAWEAYGAASQGGTALRRRTAQNLRVLSRAAAELGTPYAAATLLMVRAAAALFEYHFPVVDALARDAQRIFREQCTGTFWEESVCEALSSSALEVTGPMSLLHARATELLRRGGESPDPFAEALLSRTLSQAWLATDQPERAIAFLQERAAALSGRRGNALDLRHWLVAQSLADAYSYAGRDIEAWDTFEEIWPRYKRSLFERANFIRTASHYRRGRLAVAMAARSSDPRFARVAEGHARVLASMKHGMGVSAADTIRAALATQQGAVHSARRLLSYAERLVREMGATSVENTVRFQLGRLTYGARGQQMREQAHAALSGAGIAEPARWAAAFVSGIVVR